MTDTQAIIMIVILILLVIITLATWSLTSRVDENLRLWITEVNAKTGKYESRLSSVERKTRRKASSSTMTKEKMDAVNNWLKEVDIKTLAVVDQQEISDAAVEHIARLEAIYDKYHDNGNNINDVRYR